MRNCRLEQSPQRIRQLRMHRMRNCRGPRSPVFIRQLRMRREARTRAAGARSLQSGLDRIRGRLCGVRIWSWCCPDLTPALLGAVEPVSKYGAGACGASDCCFERVSQTHPWQVPIRATRSSIVSERRLAVDVVVERCAGLDVHRSTTTSTASLLSETIDDRVARIGTCQG